MSVHFVLFHSARPLKLVVHLLDVLRCNLREDLTAEVRDNVIVDHVPISCGRAFAYATRF